MSALAAPGVAVVVDIAVITAEPRAFRIKSGSFGACCNQSSVVFLEVEIDFSTKQARQKLLGVVDR